jgi:lipopolysaccharide transport system ATP-binding protein
MEGYLESGGTLLLCSHSMYHIQKLCRHALWLREGRIERYGDALEVSQAYLAYHEAKQARGRKGKGGAIAVPAVDVHTVSRLELNPPEGVASGGTLTVRGEVYSPDGTPPVLLVGIVRADGTPVYGVATDMDGFVPARIAPDRYAFTLTYPDLALLPGGYVLRAHAMDSTGVYLFDHHERPFAVSGQSRELGLVRLAHTWGDAAAVDHEQRRASSAAPHDG